MGERKVLNKYFPPDFDPSMRPKNHRPKNEQIKIRMMLPMSIRCNTCGNYIYKGTKFNSRKEDVIDEKYLGIQIFRFYIKCTRCSAEVTFKTDPQNSDYVVESGAARNFEPLHEQDEVVENEKRKRKAEEMSDAMKSLENRTSDSKREMDILAALDEMKSMRSRHATVSVDSMLEDLQRTYAAKELKLEEKDEACIKSTVFHTSKDFIRRIEDEDSEDEESLNNAIKRRKFSEEFRDKSTDSLTRATSSDIWNDRENSVVGLPDRSESRLLSNSYAVRISVVKKAAPTSGVSASSKIEYTEKNGAGKNSGSSLGIQILCQNYGSNDDDD